VMQGTTLKASDVVTRVVLSRAAAADADWALSFDNNMAGATAMGTVTFAPGGLIAKTGTLGSGANSAQAWFNGATPDGYAMSVALFTNDPATQILDNLPSTPTGMQGSLGGAWPASVWNNYYTKMFPNTSTTTPFLSLEANGYPFQKWVMVVAPKKKKLPLCKPGQFAKCTPGCVPTFNQPCRGGPNPNPSPTCYNQFGQCGGSPFPNPSQPAPTFSPSPSPTVVPSCTPPLCGDTAAAAAKRKAGASASLLALVVSRPEKSASAVASGLTKVAAS
jgi:membrane peptidoglycan carboxypeptidase